MILVVALLVLGPERLPEAARQAGRVLAELRRMGSGFQAELRDAIQQPVSASPASGPAPGPEASRAPANGANGSSRANGSGGAGAGGTPRLLWTELPSSTEPGEPPAPQG